MPTTFSADYEGRHVEVAPEALRAGGKVRLLVDGAVVAETKGDGPDTKLAGGGIEVRVAMPWWGGSVSRAEILREGDEPLRLEPEPGTMAARRRRFELGHPDLYAARHVARGVAQAILAIGLLAGLLPAIPLPSIDLPDIPLPSVDLPDIPWPAIPWPEIDLPDIPWPSIGLPGWVDAILDSAKYWLPILAGLGAAAGERRKRTRRRAEERPPPQSRREPS